MQVISPRLNSILKILLEAERPVSVDRLSQSLGTSRRTIFRELEGADQALRKTTLRLETKVGEGMLLAGDEEGKAALGVLLGGGSNLPQNKRDRQVLLAFLLMEAGEPQKLYYYARALGVSEATVSLDMDALAERLRPSGLILLRRQGQGAELAGAEADIRRATVDLILRLEDPEDFIKRFGHPSPRTFAGIRRLLREEWLPRLDWMTEESLDMLELQLVVAAERVRQRHLLPDAQRAAAGLPRRLAGQLCDSIESLFAIGLPGAEREAVSTLIRACRAKWLNPLDINDDAAYNRVRNLAYRMIDSFDATLSHSLKLNEDLVNGLSMHLWSAIVRLKEGLELSSAMRDQIQRDFPEVFVKSRQAAKVLEQELGVQAPDSEVAFIASHFGAALMHLGERGSRRVVLKAGIICVAGIGVSYMMASQVRRNFKGELEAVVSDWNNPEEWNEYDLLISSIPLEYIRCPVVVVNPILTPEDYESIRTVLRTHTVNRTDELPRLAGSLPDRLDKAARRFDEMAGMLRNFSRLSIHANCTFDELAKLIGYRFGSRPESGALIYEDLAAREAVATQVIPRLGIILLHARTAGVSRPAIGLVSPENGRFTGEYFSGVRGCLMMLAPKQSGKDILEVFGYVSGALVEDDVLLGAVQSGDEAVAYTRVEAALLQYLYDYWNGNLRQ
ncbi:MAG: transcription antiterminator [Oscillospiraceae bacterium]|jgi:mannitol operon transcriptional antiterminator|nr:transcription antiterminator [Oscillospiraceae bacterium]